MTARERNNFSHLSDNDIGIKLNQMDKRKCRFGADTEALEKETEVLLNELKNRGYKIKYMEVK